MGIFDFLMNSKDFYRRGYKKAYKSNWDFKGAIKDYYGAIEDFTKAIEKCGHLSVFELLSYEGRVKSKEKIYEAKL